ncbi:MAG: metalloregulator ArsR/SmtB family transcription factor [Hymenobacter sp.]
MKVLSYICATNDSPTPYPPVDLGLGVEKMQKVAFILKTTAHPTRIAIVQLLAAHAQLSVTDICGRLGSEQSLVSHHLATMKSKGILGSARSGKNIHYSLKMREVIDVIQCLAACTFL